MYRQTQHPDWAAIEDERESRTPKPDCAVRIAACAYAAGDWPSVLAEAHKAAIPENLYWASLACGKLAEQSFDRVARLPPSAEAHELLAEMNQRMGRRVEAVEEWRKALSMKPDDRRVQARLAESLVEDRRYEEAQRLLDPLVAAQPANGDWQYLLGDALLEQRRADAALPHLIASQRLQADHLPTLEALGRAYLALSQPAKAIPLLERARPLDTGAISFALSSAYRRLGREQEAQAALARYRQLSGGAEKEAVPAP
jgi:predicted Zn-dependent protease